MDWPAPRGWLGARWRMIPRAAVPGAFGGYTATAVLAGSIGAATSVWQVALLRAGAWTARGVRVPARNALLADLVPAAVYGRAYGFERAIDNLGAIVGPLLTLPLVALVGIRTAIGLSVIPGLLAAAAIVYPSAAPRALLRAIAPLCACGSVQSCAAQLGQLMFGVTAFELGNVAATLLILRATQLLSPDLGTDRATQLALGLYVPHNATATLVRIPAGRLGDRRSPTLVLVLGVALFAVAYLTFALTGPTVAVLAVAFVAAGAAIGCVETAEHAAVATYAPVELRGSAFGLLAAVQSVGNLAASGVAGIIWTAISPALAFIYVAAWMLAVLLLLLWALGR